VISRTTIVAIQVLIVICFSGTWELGANIGMINPKWFSPPIAVLAQISVLAGALCYAANGVIIRVTLRGEVMVASAAIIAIAAMVSLPVALVVDEPWQLEPGWTAISILLWIGIGPTAVATLIHLKLIASAGPTFMSLINYCIPVVALLIGVALLGEEPGASAYWGLLLILAGIALSQLRRSK